MACPPKPKPLPVDTCRLLRPKASEQSQSCPDAQFRVGNYDITYSLGCLKKTRTTNPIPDGWYNRVRIEDGQIVEVDNAETNTTLLPDLCMTQMGNGVDLETPQTQSNLSQISANQLLTRLLLAQPGPEDSVWLEGTGTQGFPLKVNINLDRLKIALGLDGGVTVDSCGLRIQNGAVTAFPSKIITGVVNNAPGVLEAFVNDQCQLVISVPGYNPETGASDANYTATRPCNTGSGTITFGVYQGEQGRFYLRVVAGGPSFSPAAPAFFETLAAAQGFISTAVGVCPDPNIGGA